jgi:hypothetical protein
LMAITVRPVAAFAKGIARATRRVEQRGGAYV